MGSLNPFTLVGSLNPLALGGGLLFVSCLRSGYIGSLGGPCMGLNIGGCWALSPFNIFS